jgi:hypothetical protein
VSFKAPTGCQVELSHKPEGAVSLQDAESGAVRVNILCVQWMRHGFPSRIDKRPETGSVAFLPERHIPASRGGYPPLAQIRS